jgi:hypothetical protein
VDEVGDFILRVVEDGLDQRLQGRVARLEVVDVLLVDALAAVVRVQVVDAFGVVDGGAGRAGGRGAVALWWAGKRMAGCWCWWCWRSGGDGVACAGERQQAKFALRTFDFLFLQGTQALEMHLRFLPSSPLPSLLLLRPFFAGVSGAASVALLSMAGGRGYSEAKMWGFERAGRANALTD